MRKRIFRSLFFVSILLTLFYISFESSWAVEKYPSRPIEIVCHVNPGSQGDLITRACARGLSKVLGVPLVPLNRPGGAGMIAVNYLLNAPPDGYTIMYHFDTLYLNILLGLGNYKFEDVRIIAKISDTSFMLVVPADSPWKTFQEAVDYAKKNPGIVTCGGAPGGTPPNILMECLKKTANLNIVFVPFPDDPTLGLALLGRHVSMGIGTLTGQKPLVDAGKLRFLFSFNPVADFGLDPSIPDWPTFFKQVTPIVSNGYMFTHSKTPDEIAQVLGQAAEKLMKDPEFLQEVKKLSIYVSFIDGKTFTEKHLPQKISTFKETLKGMGLIK